MIFYLVPIVLGLLFSFYKVKFNSLTSESAVFRNTFLFITAIIFCGGYMTGSDWPGYESLYNKATFANLNDYNFEKGFYVLMLIFKKIGFGFFPFLITLKFTVFYIIASFIIKHFKNFYFPFTIFLLYDALFLMVDNPLRFMIALGLIVLSYKFLLKRNFVRFSLITILAFLFHRTSIIMFLIYFLLNFKISNRTILIVYFFLLFTLTPTLVGKILSIFFPQIIPFINSYYNRMYMFDYNPFPIGKIVHASFLCFIIFYKKYIIKQFEDGDKIFMLTIAFFFLDLTGYIIPTFFRFKIFLSMFFYFSMAAIISYNLKYKYIVRLLFIAYLIISTLRSSYSTYVFIPYSNYFISLFQQEKSLNYRKSYNRQKYYERTGSWPEYFGEKLY